MITRKLLEKLKADRKLCDHWWKSISLPFSSPYFCNENKEPVKYQINQCKKCSLLKPETLNVEFENEN